MKKKALLFSFVILTASSVFGQVGVNTETPSATLDVTASTSTTTADGIIAPRVTLADLQTKDATYTSSQTGALVYVTDNTGTPAGKTAQITTVGYYYFDGSAWQSIGGRITVASEPWLVQSDTREATSNTDNIYQTGKVAIGSNTSGDNQFYVNGLTSINGATSITGTTSITGNATVTGNSTLGDGVYVTSDGSIGVGTTTPTAQISIVGDSNTKKTFSLKDAVVDATGEGYTGKVLTSDAFGNGSWLKPGTSYAIMGTITANTAGTSGNLEDYMPTTFSNNVGYGGMFIDLPVGSYQINFTNWVSAVASNNAASSRFASIFFSLSRTRAGATPTYATNVKSIILGPTYPGTIQNDFYGSGAIPLTITAADVQSYGAANTDADGTVDTNYPKDVDTVRIYLWVYLSSAMNPSQVKMRNLAPGFYGPYTQIYALPFAKQD